MEYQPILNTNLPIDLLVYCYIFIYHDGFDSCILAMIFRLYNINLNWERELTDYNILLFHLKQYNSIYKDLLNILASGDVWLILQLVGFCSMIFRNQRS